VQRDFQRRQDAEAGFSFELDEKGAIEMARVLQGLSAGVLGAAGSFAKEEGQADPRIDKEHLRQALADESVQGFLQGSDNKTLARNLKPPARTRSRPSVDPSARQERKRSSRGGQPPSEEQERPQPGSKKRKFEGGDLPPSKKQRDDEYLPGWPWSGR
jgi:hypothetical protein